MHVEIQRDLPTPARALAIAAHPDDAEFGCGGTLAKWAAAGSAIVHLVCTDGSKGSWDPDEDVALLVATRQEEQRAAARALGGKGEVVFLGGPDGELESGVRQRWEVAYWIRRLQPRESGTPQRRPSARPPRRRGSPPSASSGSPGRWARTRPASGRRSPRRRHG